MPKEQIRNIAMCAGTFPLALVRLCWLDSLHASTLAFQDPSAVRPLAGQPCDGMMSPWILLVT